jgi:hypothetical protein
MHDGGGHFGGGDFGAHVPHTGPDPGSHHGAQDQGIGHHGQHSGDGVPWYALGSPDRPGRARGKTGIAVIVAVIVIIALIAAI